MGVPSLHYTSTKKALLPKARFAPHAQHMKAGSVKCHRWIAAEFPKIDQFGSQTFSEGRTEDTHGNCKDLDSRTCGLAFYLRYCYRLRIKSKYVFGRFFELMLQDSRMFVKGTHSRTLKHAMGAPPCSKNP